MFMRSFGRIKSLQRFMSTGDINRNNGVYLDPRTIRKMMAQHTQTAQMLHTGGLKRKHLSKIKTMGPNKDP